MSIERKICIAGVALSLIWAGVSSLSFGWPVWLCEGLKRVTFGLFDGAFEAAKNGFYYDVANAKMPTVLFLSLVLAAFCLYLGVFRIIKRAGLGISGGKSFFVILFFSVAFRAILLPSIPVHENDIYRYLWDGKVLQNGSNPYRFTPKEVAAADAAHPLKALSLQNPEYFSRIGYPHVPTIYPPVAQSVFALSTMMRVDSILLMKSVFVFFDLLIILLLAWILRYFNKDPSLVVLYAWSPLVLKEIANSGHLDPLPVFLMLLSVCFLLRAQRMKAAFALALSGAAKFFALILLPLYAKRLKLRALCWSILICAGTFVPFFIWQRTGVARVFEGLLTYSRKWAFNGSIFVVVQSAVRLVNPEAAGALIVPKIICGVLFIVSVAYLSSLRDRGNWVLLHRTFVAVALLFLLNPVGDPWYYCWVMPFLCFFPYGSFILLSWLLFLSYFAFHGQYGYVQWGAFKMHKLAVLQYAPFYIFLLGESIYITLKGESYDND